MLYRTALLFIIFSSLDHAESARILVSIFSPSFSHNVVFRPIWKELAKRGHDITLLTTDPMRDPKLKNIREIDLSGSYEIMEKYKASELLTKGKNEGKNTVKLIVDYLNALDHTADWQLEQPEVKQLIQNTSEYFDLVIVEVMNPIQMAFAERFKVPFIGITPVDAPYRIHAALGNYMHPSVYPDYFLPLIPPLSLLQRIVSCGVNWANWFLQYYTRYPAEDLIVRKHFGEGLRDLSEIEKDMSLLFIYVNPVFYQMRPVGTNTIVIGGGMHVNKPKPLPKELREFIESNENGAIYFSLGTNVKSSLMTDNMKSVIISSLGNLPYNVLWKFEDDSIQSLPKNVKIVKWAPQQDVLGHPNIKLFITQCGLMSIDEAIYNHVPMVGMPFMGDQGYNAVILEKKRLGKRVDRMNLTEEDFTKSIIEVIKNPIYKKNVVEMDMLTKDVQTTGLEKAVWWTEYCIRTNGAKHLRSPVIDTPTYQFYYLDVIGICLTVLASAIAIGLIAIRFLLGLLCRRDSKKKTE
nr:UDP-glucuronosyltransferase 2B15-like [Leptinotarsa decemlineata]